MEATERKIIEMIIPAPTTAAPTTHTALVGTISPETQGPPEAWRPEVQAQAVGTQRRIGEMLEKFGHRLSSRQLNVEARQQIQRNPYSYVLVAFSIGVLAGLLVRYMIPPLSRNDDS